MKNLVKAIVIIIVVVVSICSKVDFVYAVPNSVIIKANQEILIFMKEKGFSEDLTCGRWREDSDKIIRRYCFQRKWTLVKVLAAPDSIPLVPIFHTLVIKLGFHQQTTREYDLGVSVDAEISRDFNKLTLIMEKKVLPKKFKEKIYPELEVRISKKISQKIVFL